MRVSSLTHSVSRAVVAVVVVVLLVAGISLPNAGAEAKPVLHEPQKPLPVTLENLQQTKTVQKHMVELIEQLHPCVVGVNKSAGVIVSADGYVVSAGHTASRCKNNVATVIMPDGKRYKADLLGVDVYNDVGLVKIRDEGSFPFVQMFNSERIAQDEWCMTMGYPAGYNQGQPAAAQVCRFVRTDKDDELRTDARLAGGYSGGPLFDSHGRLIGVNSRGGLTPRHARIGCPHARGGVP